jgi:lipoprotein-anchoring transpeptidase ErfK/SrfK
MPPKAPDVDPRLLSAAFVLVDREAGTLTLFEQRRVVRRYPVAVGAAGSHTPPGIRRIVSKQVDPTWHAPKRAWAGELAGQTVPPDDPRNPLKARYLGIGGPYGIHGTSEEWTIGKQVSPGCIRMRVPDVIDLYERVRVGTPVLIL